MARIIKNLGLNRHARALGVSPGHLSEVVNGNRKSTELLARYRAIVANDPDGSAGWKASYLPAGTAILDCTPEQIAEAKQYPHILTVDGTTMIMAVGFTMSGGPDKGPLQLHPDLPPESSETAPRPSAETLSKAGEAQPASHQG